MAPRTYDFSVVLHPADEGGFWVEVPALPGCVSQGETEAEALANIREAIELTLESMREEGEPLPPGSDAVRTVTVTVAA